MDEQITTNENSKVVDEPAELEKLWHELKRILDGSPETYNIPEIRRAFEFAKKSHGAQKRKSGEAYIFHPLRAAVTAARLHLDVATIEATLLHDVAEDTPATIEDIKNYFGEEIAFLVDGVTKLGRVKYRGIEAEIENLRKMMLAMAQDIRVILIKICDRLDNMQTLTAINPEKRRRIALETLDIYAPIARRLGVTELAGILEDLAFPFVYPEEFHWMAKNFSPKYEKRKNYIEKTLIPELKKIFAGTEVHPIDIHARAKHTYSLYRKLLKYDMNLDQIYDLVAARIIVPNIEACYLALGIIHKNWKPSPGRIKDYIAMPKPNGYRSLHTTIFGPNSEIVEIQIRTPEMHNEAERGAVAHWLYSRKDSKEYREDKSVAVPAKELAWVQQLSEWQKNSSATEEYIESLKIDFFKDRIFAITPKGDAIDLPEGATPVDFAYQIHSDIGNQCAGCRVNGNIAPLDYQLRSGDIVEILIQKNKKPSESWLEFVKTSYARNKITDAIQNDTLRASIKPKKKTYEFRIEASDRVGLLRDVTHTFAESKLNIAEVLTKTEGKYPIIIIRAEVPDENRIEKLAVRLRKVNGVEGVSYKIK